MKNSNCTTGTWLSFLILLISTYTVSAQSPYPHFTSWEKVHLKGGMLVASPYHTIFEDQFNGADPNTNTGLDETKWDRFASGNDIGGRFHCGAGSTIFLDDNVEVSDGLLKLTVKTESAPIVLDDPNSPTFDAHCFDDVPYVRRNVSAGMVMVKPELVYNLGKYEIKCQFPNKGGVWSAFWMWHHDEIDIFDIGFRSKMNQNSFSGGYTASVFESPCCPYIVDCDYCSDLTNSVDCGGSNNCSECGDWNCEYMANGMHIVGCEWTPFKVRFYVDGVTTGTVYRYYRPDKTPVDVEPGGIIPEGLVMENPAYIDIQGRGFSPQIWITAESDYSATCDYNGCPISSPEMLPATLLVDYVKIEERAYERISLVPECYELCAGSHAPVCVRLESEYYNFIYNGEWNWSGPTPPSVLNWGLPHQNGTLVSSTPSRACFTYNGLDCQSGCSRQLQVRAVVQTHSGVYNLIKTLTQPKPSIDRIQGTSGICIDRGNYCGDYTIKVDGQPIGNGTGIDCYEGSCAEVTYNDCGSRVSFQGAFSLPYPPQGIIQGSNQLITSDGVINWLDHNYAYFCYPPGSNPGLTITSLKKSTNMIHASINNNCVYIIFSGTFGVLDITFDINGCKYTQTLIFAVNQNAYRVFPNPSTGIVNLEADVTPEMIQLEDQSVVELRAFPQYLRVFNANNVLVSEMSLDENQGLFQFNLPPTSLPGQYIIEIQDKKTNVPYRLSLQKQ